MLIVRSSLAVATILAVSAPVARAPAAKRTLLATGSCAGTTRADRLVGTRRAHVLCGRAGFPSRFCSEEH
jgi:hypothetical protein